VQFSTQCEGKKHEKRCKVHNQGASRVVFPVPLAETETIFMGLDMPAVRLLVADCARVKRERRCGGSF
jgi:hypothetical protein